MYLSPKMPPKGRKFQYRERLPPSFLLFGWRKNELRYLAFSSVSCTSHRRNDKQKPVSKQKKCALRIRYSRSSSDHRPKIPQSIPKTRTKEEYPAYKDDCACINMLDRFRKLFDGSTPHILFHTRITP